MSQENLIKKDLDAVQEMRLSRTVSSALDKIQVLPKPVFDRILDIERIHIGVNNAEETGEAISLRKISSETP